MFEIDISGVDKSVEHYEVFSNTADDIRAVVKFKNGYGASIVRNAISHGYSDGLVEVAVLEYSSDDTWKITCSTPITSDVIGWLDEEGLGEVLNQISALPQIC